MSQLQASAAQASGAKARAEPASGTPASADHVRGDQVSAAYRGKTRVRRGGTTGACNGERGAPDLECHRGQCGQVTEEEPGRGFEDLVGATALCSGPPSKVQAAREPSSARDAGLLSYGYGERLV